VEYLLSHRGVTHSLVLLPAWAVVFSWILAKLLREPGGWRALYGVTALALLVHIAGDVITSFGTMVLAPFSDRRAAIGTTFIIDLWFSGIILAGLVASAIFDRSRAPAIAATVLLVGYVGVQFVQKQNALELGLEYAKSKGLDARITAHPRPVSPFNWTVFVSDDEAHRFAHVNLVRKEPRRFTPGEGFIARIDSPYMPAEQAIWVTRPRYGHASDNGGDRELIKEAWNSEALAFFRWFADVPAFDGMSEGSTCVWFADLRFLTPGREWLPFRYGACRDRPGEPWRGYERAEPGAKILLR
jgi:inner membrane protein